MPIVSEPRTLASVKENQSLCKICSKKEKRNERTHICDICSEWVCKTCSNINDNLYELATQTTTKINFVCDHCELELPQIRDLMKLKAKQDKMEEEISNIKNSVTINTKKIQEQEEKATSNEQRLTRIEQLLEKNHLDNEEYPPLLAISNTTKTLAQKISSQQDTTNKLDEKIQNQQEQKAEEKRQAARASNLIVYGIPEEENSEEQQMKKDFLILKEILSDRVSIRTSDIRDIIRLGTKKEDQTRPVKITCTSLEKRKEILTNNKNLRIENEEFNFCNCKMNPGNHIHINITNDKTLKQREDEAKLREELKTRRAAGERITIKQGKIVKLTKTRTHARWVELVENGE